MTSLPCFFCLLCSICQGVDAGPSTVAKPINSASYRAIVVPRRPHNAESWSAAILQSELKAIYRVELDIVHDAPGLDSGAIFVGAAAVAARIISKGDLERVKFDGYVIRGRGNRVGLAGYDPQGTLYATHAFLRLAGLRQYPWRNFGAVLVIRPVQGGVLQPFNISEKPFFARRDLLGWLDRGRWGASLREYSLGEFRFAKNHNFFKGKGWLGGDHTAPYLVPMGLYYETHPVLGLGKLGGRLRRKDYNGCPVSGQALS